METTKLTLTKVTRLTKDKAGQPLVTKDNRPYTRLLINCQEYGQNVLSGFDNEGTKSWTEGTIVDVIVTKVIKGDKEYLNFAIPKKEDKQAFNHNEVMIKLGKIEYMLGTVIDHLSTKNRLDLTSTGEKVPDFSEVDDVAEQVFNQM